MASAIGSPLALRHAAERPWRARTERSARALWQRLARRDDPLPKLALLVGVAALAAATLWPVAYRVGAPARARASLSLCAHTHASLSLSMSLSFSLYTSISRCVCACVCGGGDVRV